MAARRKVGKFDHSTMRKAVLRVIVDGCTIRSVAKEFKLSYATLRQYVSKYNATDDEDRELMRFSPNYKVNLVFSEELENELVQYLIVARRLRYSLTEDDVRRLSYELAIKHDLRIPPNWEKSNKVGKCWMHDFLKRHPQIKNILNLSKRFRPIETSDLHIKQESVNDKNELIIEENNLDNFIESDEEEVVLTSKPVIIIPVKKGNS